MQRSTVIVALVSLLTSCGYRADDPLPSNSLAENSPIVLLDEQSYFSDFEIEKETGKVTIRCSLNFQNVDDSEHSFCVEADFQKEQEHGLLSKEETSLLRGCEIVIDYNSELIDGKHAFIKKAESLTLQPGETEVYEIAFTGKWGGAETKPDRLLPENIYVVVDDVYYDVH